ncbi:MAG: serine/threonine protein kinase [Chloroflexi bacterium]|nr:serine/threonine protein kinase [Chloroflexota bacterium]
MSKNEQEARERHARIKAACEAALGVAPAERRASLASRLGDEGEVHEALRLLEEQEKQAERERAGSAHLPTLGHAGGGGGAGGAGREAAKVLRGGVAVGGRIGPYEVVKWLGGGGMGDVYLCTKPEGPVRMPVAVKVVRKGMDSDAVLKRFEQERVLLGSLSQANIARMLDAGMTESGSPYLVMEYVEGQQIDAYCNDKRLSVQERLALFRKVCDAVHFAHSNLIVHRDLKPSNILVDRNGEPKLVDFGIAKILNPAFRGDGVFTLDTQRLMTPQYASPEQISGKLVGTATDVYSLGVVLYELLTGRRPYALKRMAEEEMKRVVCELVPAPPSLVVAREPAGEDAGALTADDTRSATGLSTSVVIATNRGTRPAALRRALHGDLDTIVLHALEKVDRRRYKSVAEFAGDIDNYFEGRSLVARPPSAWADTWKFVQRHRVGAGATLAIAATLAISSGVMWGLMRRAEAAERQTRAEKTQTLEVFDRFAGAMTAVRNDRDGTLTGTTLAKAAEPMYGAVDSISPADVDLQRKAAAAIESYGLTLGTANWGGGQREAEADAAFTRAIAVRRLVAERPGATATDLTDLARTLQLAADNLRWTKDAGLLAKRQDLALKSLERCDLAMKMEPSSVAVKAARAAALYMLARHAQPDDSRVKGWLDECYALRMGLLSEAPGDRTVRGDLAATLMLMTNGDRAGATAAERSVARDRLEKAVDLRRGVADELPDEWEPKVLLLRALTRLGHHLCWDMDNKPEGVRRLEQAVLLAEQVVRGYAPGRMPPNVRVAAIRAYGELAGAQEDVRHVKRMWELLAGTIATNVDNDRGMITDLMQLGYNATQDKLEVAERRTFAGLVELLARGLDAADPPADLPPMARAARLGARVVLAEPPAPPNATP